MTEEVLVIKESTLNEICQFTGFIEDNQYIDRILDNNNLLFINRDDAENDPSYKQIIPYCIIQCGIRIFNYQRSKKGNESRLHQMRSIGIGGHINKQDHPMTTFEFTSIGAYYNGIQRELKEEVSLKSSYFITPIGMIYDPSNDVGKVHLGIINLISITEKTVELVDESLINGRFDTRQYLIDNLSDYENWSKLIINSM